MKGKKMKPILMVLLLVSLASCQTFLPGWVAWDYDYSSPHPEYADSTNIVFDVFYGQSMADTNFVKLDSTQEHKSRLLTHDFLYQNQGYYFFCRARALSDGALSLNSDTIYAYFPKIIAEEPYNITTLKTALPK